jgi:hypothetical protein
VFARAFHWPLPLDEYSPHPPPSCLFKTHINIIPSSTPRSSKLPLSFRVSKKNLYAFYFTRFYAILAGACHLPLFDYSNNICREVRVMKQFSQAPCYLTTLKRPLCIVVVALAVIVQFCWWLPWYYFSFQNDPAEWSQFIV